MRVLSQVAAVALQMGNIYFAQRQWAEAVGMYRQALQVRARPSDSSGIHHGVVFSSKLKMRRTEENCRVWIALSGVHTSESAISKLDLTS